MLKKVYLELTDRCNLECKICYRHQWNVIPADMNEALLGDVLNQIKQMSSVETIVLGGMGEPLVSPRFANTLKHLAGRKIWVTTNSTMMREKLTPELLALTELFVVSVDGMELQMIAGRGVEFATVMDNIDYLNELKAAADMELPHLDIHFVATRQNISDIFPLMDVLAGKNIRYLVLSHLLPQELNQSEDILYKKHGNKEVRDLFHAIRNYSFKKGLRVIFPEVELKTERRCEFVAGDAAYITSDGDVVPCYRLSHQGKEVVFGRSKTIRRYSFGNIATQTLENIWNSNAYRQFRNRIYNNHYPSCPDCDLAEGCSLIKDVDFDCHGDEPNCADCLWSRRFVFCR
jgi:tungsten cofactor oxidoreducase radical SAM maturase